MKALAATVLLAGGVTACVNPNYNGLTCDTGARLGVCPNGLVCGPNGVCVAPSSATTSGGGTTGGTGSTSGSTGSSLPPRPDGGGLLGDALCLAALSPNNPIKDPEACPNQSTWYNLGVLDGGACVPLPVPDEPTGVAVDGNDGLWIVFHQGNAPDTSSGITHLARDGTQVGTSLANTLPLGLVSVGRGQALVSDSAGDWFLVQLTGAALTVTNAAISATGQALAFDPRSGTVLSVQNGALNMIALDGGQTSPLCGRDPNLVGVGVIDGGWYATDQDNRLMTVFADGGCALLLGQAAGVTAADLFVDGEIGAQCQTTGPTCQSDCAVLCAPHSLAPSRGNHFVVYEATTTAIRDVALDQRRVTTVLLAPPDISSGGSCQCMVPGGHTTVLGCASEAAYGPSFFEWFSSTSEPIPGNVLAADAIGDIYAADWASRQIKVLTQN